MMMNERDVPSAASSSSKAGTIPAIGIHDNGTGSVASRSAVSSSSARDEERDSTFFHPRTQQQKNQRHNIHVLFLAANQNDFFMNKLTSIIGSRVHKHGFCHAEIVIPDMAEHRAGSHAAGSFLSSSIYQGETVTLTKTKTFANPGYTVLTFTVNGIELASIADYLYESKRMQLKFDSVGMYLAALPFQLNPFASSGLTTFCSKHVTTALKSAGIEAVTDLNANIVTPSKLYRVLHDSISKDRMVVGSVQYKQDALMNNASMFSVN